MSNCTVVKSYFSDIEYLGSGCFGEVYCGKEKSSGQTCALKVLPQCQSALDEMRALYGLPDHPNIIRYYRQFVMSTGSICLVMEYCCGGNLNDFLVSHNPEQNYVLRFMKEIASAVAFLHGNGVVHRDLKPDNILLTVDGTLKVADFGLAKIASSFQPHNGSLYNYYINSGQGHRFFLAPEVIDGRPTEKADVFQMGVIFACILERKTIKIQGKPIVATFIQTRSGSVGIGRALHGGLLSKYRLSKNTRFSQALHDLVEDMLRKDHHRRPTAAKVYDLLRMQNGWLAEEGSILGDVATVGLGVLAVAGVATLFALGIKN